MAKGKKYKPYHAKKDSKLKSKTQGVRTTIWPPEWVLVELDVYAARERCSRTWAVTEAICDFLGIDESRIAEERGYEIPKKIDDRKNNPEWSPNTTASRNKAKRKSNKSKKEEYFEKAAKEEGTWFYSDSDNVLMKKCITPGCRGDLSLVKQDVDIPYWEAGVCADFCDG